MISRRRLLALGCTTIAGVVVAACSDDDAPTTSPAPTSGSTEPTEPAATVVVTDPAPPTEAPTTTISPAEAALAFAEPGPYPVGVRTLALDKGPLVEVWYPAVAGTTGEVTYDVRDYTPESIKALLTADIPATFTIQAGRDADVSTESVFPLVLFSHGFTGIRVQSSFLTAHLASWGFVVAAPDHPSRDLPNVLGGTASGDRTDSVDDLLKTLELMQANNDDPASSFSATIDTSTTLVTAVGHSAGGGTVLAAAADPRIGAYVSLASGALLGGGSGDPTDAAATTTTTLPALPGKPSFFMAGALDGVVLPERTREAYELAPEPSLLWVIDGVGHNGFDDFCTLGGGTGIIGVAEASGLGSFFESEQGERLRTLGEDGCVPPAVPVDETFPMIRHAVTAWIRGITGLDETVVGIDESVADQYTVAVEIQQKG